MRRDRDLLEELRLRPGTSDLTIETGSESHTTSWGSVKITTLHETFLSNEVVFEKTRQNGGYWLTTFLLPVGSQYIVTSKGVSGPRGVNKDRIEMIIEITASNTTSRKDWQLPAGPHDRTCKGCFKVVWANREARDHFGLAQTISQKARKERLLAEVATPSQKEGV